MGSFSRGPAEIKPPPAAPTPPPQRAPAARAQPSFDEPPAPAPQSSSSNGGAWTWRELLSSIDDESGAGAAAPPRNSGGRERERDRERAASAPPPRRGERDEDDAITRLTQAVTEQRGAHPIGAVTVIENAGVQMAEVFTVAALDRIAHRARNGSQARRKAVKDAVGAAVNRLREHLRRDERARQEAAGFLRTDGARIAELLSRGRASMSADATRAFLLLDAAEG